MLILSNLHAFLSATTQRTVGTHGAEGSANSEMVFSRKAENRQIDLKVKVKFSLEQAMTAQRGSRSIAVLFL